MKTFHIRQRLTTEDFAALTETLEGSTWDGRQLLLNTPKLRVRASLYYELSEMDVAVIEVWSADEDVLIKDMEEGEGSTIIRFLQQGAIYQEEHSKTTGKSNPVGASMYNTAHPMELLVPAGEWVRWVAVRNWPENWRDIAQNRWNELVELIYNKEEWVIYEPLTLQMEHYLGEIYAVQDKVKEGGAGRTLGYTLLLLTEFFLEVMKRKKEKNSIGPLTADFETIFAIKEALVSRLTAPPHMDELTREFGMSETRLRNNFKKVFGMPPRQYVLRERFRQGYKLVCTTDKPLMDIALSLGFAHTTHFTNGFKKEFGVTPSQLRSK